MRRVCNKKEGGIIAALFFYRYLATADAFDRIAVADVSVVFGAGKGHGPGRTTVWSALWCFFVSVSWLEGNAVAFAFEGDCTFKWCDTAAF